MAWLYLVGALVVIGSLGVLFSQGIWKFWEVMSPFNIVNWLIVFVVALPGLLLVRFSEK
jgi:hypothetical protein